MPGLKTNEREGTRAVLRHARVTSYKVREVLDLVRGKPVHEAEDILRFSERDAAFTVGKVLHSAVANAENNDELDPEELFVSACFADEGTTIKRWRPRARGRATRIRKRTCHITVIVSRMPDQQLQRLQARRRAEQLAQRARRVAGARRSDSDQRPRAERRHGTDTDLIEDSEVVTVPDEGTTVDTDETTTADTDETTTVDTDETTTAETVDADADADAGADANADDAGPAGDGEPVAVVAEHTIATGEDANPEDGAPAEDGPAEDERDER
jgi:large subunit ribosomal protein L22